MPKSHQNFSSETNHAQTLVHGLKTKLSGKNLPTDFVHLTILLSKFLHDSFRGFIFIILTISKSSHTFPSHTHTFVEPKNDDKYDKIARNI